MHGAVGRLSVGHGRIAAGRAGRGLGAEPGNAPARAAARAEDGTGRAGPTPARAADAFALTLGSQRGCAGPVIAAGVRGGGVVAYAGYGGRAGGGPPNVG